MAVANAGLLAVGHHGHSDGGHYNGHDDHNGPAHYEFNYAVHDPHTGDVKEQHESRDGHSVNGHYSLVEPDGHRRTVHYSSDEHNGFNAQVTRDAHNVHIEQAHGGHYGGGYGNGHSAGHVLSAGHGHSSGHGVATSHSSVTQHNVHGGNNYGHDGGNYGHGGHIQAVHAVPVVVAAHGISSGHGHSGHGVATSHSSITQHNVHNGGHGYHH